MNLDILNDNKTFELVKSLFIDENSKPIILTPTQLQLFNLIFKKASPRNHIMCHTRFGKSFIVGLSVLLRVATFPEKWCIVAPSEKKAKIIMGYIIEHTFDNEYFKSKLQYDETENLDRLRRERSKNRLTYKHSDGRLGEVFVLTADSRNRQSAGDSVMGFGCIPAGFKITTDKGDFDIKDIVENKIDCLVLSYNHETNKVEYKKILDYQKNSLSDRYLIEFDLGDTKFQCTNDHPVFVKDRGYVKAGDVNLNDKVLVV